MTMPSTSARLERELEREREERQRQDEARAGVGSDDELRSKDARANTDSGSLRRPH
jgi:hypothetical protein